MRRALLLLVLLSLAVAIVPRADANHPSGWHWRRGSNPVTIRVINGTSGVWADAVSGAAGRWSNKSTVVDLAVEGGPGGCAAVAGAVKVCSGDFAGSWAGLTEVGLSGDHAQWATVKLDDSASGAKRAVACHELGHALGLAHRPAGESTSCMTPSVSSSQTRVDDHDLRMLKRIYKHLDGSGLSTSEVRVVRIYTYLPR
jgi:hypothetical protein